MNKGQKLNLEIRGEPLKFTVVGCGATTYAFSEQGYPQTVWLMVPDLKFKDGTSVEDLAKDVLAQAYQANKDNPYLPQVAYQGREFVGGPELDRPCKIYKMPYYRDLTQRDKKPWLEMKRLHKVRDDAMHEVLDYFEELTKKKAHMRVLGRAAAERACQTARKKLNEVLVEALTTIYKQIPKSNPGLTFEFNKDNVGLGPNKLVILRDPVYDASITAKILEDRKEN